MSVESPVAGKSYRVTAPDGTSEILHCLAVKGRRIIFGAGPLSCITYPTTRLKWTKGLALSKAAGVTFFEEDSK